MTFRRILISVLISAGPWGSQTEGAVQQIASLREIAGDSHVEETSRLQMNFRNTAVDTVLDYLSSAAGFIINKTADPKGAFDFSSKDPLTKDQALTLVNSVLNKSGYTLLSDGKILTLTTLDSIKTTDLEVVSGNNPEALVKSDQVITQIIPIHYANASQLVNNLQQLLPTSASLSANESANSLVLVASKTVIRRMLRIVKALDTSIATVTSIKVFPLRYADAKQLATVIQQFFSTQNSSTGINAPAAFGPPGFGGPPGQSQSTQETGQASAASKVVAAADETSNSLIVSASSELLLSISGIVQQVDRPVTAATEVRIFNLRNADPAEVADQLTQLFPGSSSNGSDQNQQTPIFGGPPGAGGGPGFIGGPGGPGGPPNFDTGNGNSTTGTRSRTRGQVIAVADPRTSSLLVSASSLLMPSIAKMIDQLDASSARRELVKVFEIKNADPQDVNQVLQDLFNRNSSMRNNNNNTRSLLGQNNPLTQRATQQQTTSSQSSGFGNTGGQGAGGGAGAGAP